MNLKATYRQSCLIELANQIFRRRALRQNAILIFHSVHLPSSCQAIQDHLRVQIVGFSDSEVEATYSRKMLEAPAQDKIKFLPGWIMIILSISGLIKHKRILKYLWLLAIVTQDLLYEIRQSISQRNVCCCFVSLEFVYFRKKLFRLFEYLLQHQRLYFAFT